MTASGLLHLGEINMYECLYHRDKVAFDNVRKDLQKLKVIPRKYGPRLAMAVCSCRKRDTLRINTIPEDNSQDKMFLYEDLKQPKWSVFLDTWSFVWTLLETKIRERSRTMLVRILASALQNDFSILQEELNHAANKIKLINPKQKMSPSAAYYVIRKKMKASLVKGEAILPIYGGCSNILVEKCGKGFCKVGKRYNCVVKMEGDKTQAFMDRNVAKTVLTIWCQSNDCFREVEHHLISISVDIQTVVDTERRRKRKERMPVKTDKDVDTQSENLTWKLVNHREFLREEYSKKMSNDNKHNIQSLQKEESRVLQGGHCYYCYKPFGSLKVGSDESCVYHPGYIAENRSTGAFLWSCCLLKDPNLDSKSSYEVHAANGCTLGRHLWRPHKKASRCKKNERRYWTRVFRTSKAWTYS